MPRVSVLVDVKDLRQKIADAAPGQKIEYHRGLLADDRRSQLEGGARRPQFHDRETINKVAEVVWSMWKNGFVHMAQRRICPGEFSYFVVKRPRPHVAPKPWFYAYPDGGKK